MMVFVARTLYRVDHHEPVRQSGWRIRAMHRVKAVRTMP